MKRLSFIPLLAYLSLAACTGELTSTDDDANSSHVPQSTSTYTGQRADDVSADIIDSTDADHYWENSTFTDRITVVYNDTTATVTDATGKAVVTQNGAHVAIDLAANTLAGVEIMLSGSSSDGSLKVYSANKYKLTLDGVSLTSKRGAAINNQSAKRTFVVVEGDNYLTDATELADDIYYATGASGDTEDEKGCLFSQSHLIFSGNGLLCLIGNRKHAIATDDTFYMRPGVTLAIKTCAADAIHANEGIAVTGGMINVEESCSDGMECDEGSITISGGNILINSIDDAITTSYEGTDATVVPDINITGGTLTLTTTGEKGMGLKAEGNIAISDGNVSITVSGVASKCIKSTLDTEITGGTLTLATSGPATYDTAEADTSSAACIKTGGDLTIDGTASITASSTGTGGKGISTDGDLAIGGGTVLITTTGGQFAYQTTKAGPGGGGGWHPDADNNNSGITSSSKGIRTDGDMIISGGSVTVKTSQSAATSDGSGCEGIESKSTITISGGTVSVEAFDDCINAANSMLFSGGQTYAYSHYNDGIDSNGTLTVSGGTVIASGTKAPEEGFDCDWNTFKITGGIIIGSGGATSYPTTSVCTQRSVVAQNVSMTKGATLNMKDSSGNTLLNYRLPRTMTGTILLISTPDIVSGGKYTFSTGGTVSSADSEWNGYFIGGTYAGGTTQNISTSIK